MGGRTRHVISVKKVKVPKEIARRLHEKPKHNFEVFYPEIPFSRKASTFVIKHEKDIWEDFSYCVDLI
ncbi:CLUMA_CG006187, isoform A [Clunio marinus]|uniref:CLUMA_CG006187, isoform A n=1 Tax=Clunio marinus TaxID=568069 RepID=A0A1J1HWZ6_9DIPT|nr:CLUMA_CG006187, isoform A [Clunio marinus]